MKIDSAYVGMDSARSFSSYALEKVRTRYYNADSAQGWDTGGYSFSQLLSFAGDGSEEFGKKISESKGNTGLFGISQVNSNNTVRQERHIESIRQACIMFFVRWLYNGLGYRRVQSGDVVGQTGINAASLNEPVLYSEQPAQGLAGTGFSRFYGEMEETSYKTQGCVRTSDGREISFELSLGMSRSFCEYTGINSVSQLPLMTDPLVINIDAPIAEVSDQKFMFDIDADGSLDEISAMSSGSGFLALDKNDDGIINDGTELFGTGSGNGFYDLSEYDKDANGWIDENDEVFDRLKIWCKSPDGSDVLYTLKEAGVGAICLQNAATDFSLNSLSDNRVNARIRRTGVFLYENGSVGTMQQVDFAG